MRDRACGGAGPTDGAVTMVTSRRLSRVLATGGLGFLLGGVLVAGVSTPALGQPDQIPDAGARPAPAGEVPLPDGSSTRFPANPDLMAGPLAGDISATEAEIATVVQRLRELEPRLDLARLDRRDAETTWQAAEDARVEAQEALDELVEEAYRQIAGVPGPLLEFPLPELSGAAVAPVDPIGGEVAGRKLRRTQQAVARADEVLRAARDAEQALTTQVRTYEGRLTTLQAELDDLRDRNATLLAQQEAEEQRRAAERTYPLQDTVAGLRAHPRAQRAVRFALGELGKPYEWGAEGPDRYDCSGLMWAAYGSVGVRLPRVAADQYQGTRTRPVSRQALLPGDLIFFSRSADWRDVHHVGMYIGEGRMVHAPNRNDVVKVSPVWWSGFFGATRVIDAVPAGGAGSPSDPSTPPPGTGPTPTPPPGTGTPSTPPGTPSTPPSTGTPTTPPATGTSTPSPGPTMVSVPPLVGEEVDDALAALTAAGLVPAAGDPLAVAGCDLGTVAGQDPPADTEVAVGSTVTYQICELEVPSTDELPGDSATLALEALGLEVQIEYEVDGGVPLGQVIRTDPAAGTALTQRGTVVTVYVSGVAVPDVVGLPRDDAERDIDAAGLTAEVSGDGPEACDTLPETVPETVACQTPTAGSVQAAGTAVAITLFPPAPEPTPSTSPEPSASAEPAGAAALGESWTLLWQVTGAPVLV